MSFIEGYLVGLGMVIFVGPVFFMLLNSSLQYGTLAGISVALGIIVSDIVCVMLCYYGVSSFFNSQEHQVWIGLIGSSILLVLGIYYVIKRVVLTTTISITSRGLITFFVKGFSINFFNPFVFIVWISIFQYGTSRHPTTYVLFLIAVLLGILTLDILKVFLSKKIKKIMAPQRLRIFYKITGIVLIVFSIRLMYLIL